MAKICIYHADCIDGFGAAYAHWLYNDKEVDDGEQVFEYFPVQYNSINTPADFFNAFPELARYETHELVILDFSFPMEVMRRILFHHTNIHVTWLDHHKTAFETASEIFPDCKYPEYFKLVADNCFIILDNNRSGALIAAEVFGKGVMNLKERQLFKRISDRDLWKFELIGTREMHAALASYPRDFKAWFSLSPLQLIKEGGPIMRAESVLVNKIAEKYAVRTICGEYARIVNCIPQLASEVGNKLADDTFIAMTYHIRDDMMISVSLRSKGDKDVSAIAKKFNGGGHKNAAGFTTTLDVYYDIMLGVGNQ